MDSTIITCDCGAKLRLPENAARKSLRCPRCATVLAPIAAAGALASTPLAVGEDSVCPICQSKIDASEEVRTCQTCHQVHHQECWNEVGGCATYGCKEAPVDDKSEQAAAARTSAWGDTKRCPACGEVIKAIALRCRFCKTDFASVDPMTVADLRKQAVTGDKLAGLKQMVVILFVVSLVGVVAPLALIFGLVYLLPRRALLAKSGPIFVIMGWTAVALSAAWSLLILVFIVLG